MQSKPSSSSSQISQSLHSLKCEQQQIQYQINPSIIIDENIMIKKEQISSNNYSFEDQQNKQEQEPGNKKKSNKKSDISNFIIKTYRILQDRKNKQIIEWTDQGNCFIVKNKDMFENHILPKYFKHKKFSSFVRQLNMYDFHKIRKQKQIPIFKHKYFKMGCIQLLHKIKRKSGQDIKQDQQNPLISGIIPTLTQLAQKPLLSTFSLKSKSQIPYHSSHHLSHHLFPIPAVPQLSDLIQQNHQLTTSISQLTHQQISLELARQKKKQKITKIISALVFIESPPDQKFQGFTLRDLHNHVFDQDEPFTFQQYASHINKIYQQIKMKIITSELNNVYKDNLAESHDQEQNKIQIIGQQ